jgi:hypothetical protein
MNRSDILKEAERCITKDRAATHGNAEDNFAAIAGGWEWWLSIREHGPLCAFDVAMMMQIFKTARAASNKAHHDNFVDGAGYYALAGEIATKPAEPVTPRPDAGDRLSPAFQSVRNKHVTPSKSHAL